MSCSEPKITIIDYSIIDKVINSLGFVKEYEDCKYENLNELFLFENIKNVKGGYYLDNEEVKWILKNKTLDEILSHCKSYEISKYRKNSLHCSLNVELFYFGKKTYTSALFDVFQRYSSNEKFSDNFPNQQVIFVYDDVSFLIARNYCNSLIIDDDILLELFGENKMSRLIEINNFNY